MSEWQANRKYSVCHYPDFRTFLSCELIAVRKRSCGKVMFSQACVKNCVHGGGVYTPGQTPLGRHPPWQTPPSRHPLGRPPPGQTPLQADTPLGSHPPWAVTTPSGQSPPSGQTPPPTDGYHINHPTGCILAFLGVIDSVPLIFMSINCTPDPEKVNYRGTFSEYYKMLYYEILMLLKNSKKQSFVTKFEILRVQVSDYTFCKLSFTKD